MAAPKAVADIRDTFQTNITQLQEQTQDAGKACRAEAQRPWMTPATGDWNGDLFNLTGLAKPFDRKENHEDFIKALTDSPCGVVGDLEVSQLQGEFLATAERSFRARHTTRCRADQHAGARLSGHGHAQGLFKKSILGYLQGIVQNSKNQPRT